MMTPHTKIRVSIFERIVPALAFAIVALSGAIASGMLLKLLSDLSKENAVGYAVVFDEFSKIEVAVGIVLAFAAMVGAIGILVSAIRLFTTNTTASPPGLLFLILGLLSLVPPIAYYYLLYMIKVAVLSPDPSAGGIGGMMGTISAVSYLAIGSACVIELVLIAFSFIPFSSRPGKKASPLICLILVNGLIVALCGLYFWQARQSLLERDRPREEPPYRSSSETTDANDYDSDFDSNSNEADNTYNAPANSNSNSQVKTISGGVLNDKAIDLPKPEYPVAARAVRATGSVSVKVTIDEKGEVVEATAVSGHPLLRASAVQAARRARFAPTKFSGKPVKVTGVLTYSFSEQ